MKVRLLLSLCGLLISSAGWAQFANTAFFKRRAATLSFITASQNVYTGNCSGVTTVQTKNPSGVATNVVSTLTVNLATTGSLTFYSDSGCSTAITSVSILAGQSSANFYFSDTAVENPTVTASATGYLDATQSETFTLSPFIWTGNGGNALWSTAANWRGNAVPGNSDVAIFDSTCTANCSPTITASIDVGGVKMNSGYSGTITQNAGVTIKVWWKGWNQAAGNFVGSSSTGDVYVYSTFTLSGGSFTAPASRLNFPYSISAFTVQNTPTFNHNSGTVYFDNCSNPVITPGSITFNNLEFGNACNWSGGTLNGTMKVAGNILVNSSGYQGTIGAGGTINLSGNLTMNSTSWGFASTCQLRMVGGIGSNVSITTAGYGALGALEIASLGTVNFVGGLGINGDFKYTSGTVNAGTSNVRISAYGFNQTVNSGSMDFYDLTFAPDAYNGITLTGTVHVAHDLYLSTVDSRSNVAGGTIEVKGNMNVTSSGNNGTSPILMSGSSNQTITVNAGAWFYQSNITVQTSGGASVNLGSDFLMTQNPSQTLTINSGSVNMAGHNFSVKTLSLNSNTITRGGGTLTVNGTVVGGGTVSAYGGTVAP